MQRTTRAIAIILGSAFAAALAGCSSDAGDAAPDEAQGFDQTGAIEDSPEMVAALLAANTFDEGRLRAVGLDENTTAAILEYRAGADKQASTDDDEIFATLASVRARRGVASDVVTKLVMDARKRLPRSCRRDGHGFFAREHYPVEITEDTVWEACPLYDSNANRLEGTVHVAAGATLTIAPGMTIAVGPSGAIVVDGSIVALGAKSAPIRFVGQDGAAAKWEGITIGANGPPSALSFVAFEGTPTAVTVKRDAILSNLDIVRSHAGITIESGRVLVKDSWLEGPQRFEDNPPLETLGAGVRVVGEHALAFIHRSVIRGYDVGVLDQGSRYVELIDSEVTKNGIGVHGIVPEPPWTPPIGCNGAVSPGRPPPPGPSPEEERCALLRSQGWDNIPDCNCPTIEFSRIADNRSRGYQADGPVETHVVSSEIDSMLFGGGSVFSANTFEKSNFFRLQADYVNGALDVSRNYWAEGGGILNHADYPVAAPDGWQTNCKVVYDSVVKDIPHATKPFVVGPRARLQRTMPPPPCHDLKGDCEP